MLNLSKEQLYTIISLNRIDINSLERNYIERPLQKVGDKTVEHPTKRDIEYLYMELNLPLRVICSFLCVSERFIINLCKKFCLKKTRQMIAQCAKKTFLLNYGVDNPAKATAIKEKIYETNIEKYGVSNPMQNKEIKEKAIKTNIEKYGVSNVFQSEKIKQKIKESNKKRYGCDYGLQSRQVREKIEKTNLEKIGVDNPFKSKEVQERIKETNLKKYGNSNPACNSQIKEKTKQTNLQRFGVECPAESKEVQEKICQTNLKKLGVDYPLKSRKIRDKAKVTWKSKYGVDNPFKSEVVKEKYKKTLKDRYGVEYPAQNLQVQEKIYKTKRKNNTFGTSFPEEKVFSILVKKFPDTIRQYKDKIRYPFACDFYIPSLDLFIEYNEHWTHGGHPFGMLNQDIETANKWTEKAKTFNFKQKCKNYYLMALQTWTISDVKKRKVALDNKLNYLEFFSLKDFQCWFEKLK